MGFNFPNNPTPGQIFQPVGGPQFTFLNGVWRLMESPQDVGRALPFNHIVNGAMHLGQENGTTAGTVGGYYVADQWNAGVNGTGWAHSFGRVLSPTPNNSPYRLRWTVTTIKASLAATDYTAFFQTIEGVNSAPFGWGTATAQPVVLRFGFRGPAGTYSIALRNQPVTHSFVKSFTVSAAQANTDIEVIIPIPVPSGGVWSTDTTIGIYLNVLLASGANWLAADNTWNAGNFIGVTGMSNGAAALNVFELFDVGLYADPENTGVPPPWQKPDYAEEMLRCRRYYAKYISPFMVSGHSHVAGQDHWNSFQYQVQMRVNPAITFVTPALANTTAMLLSVANVDGLRASVSATAGSTNGTTTYGIAPNVICDARM